jgi:hypothetical protein
MEVEENEIRHLVVLPILPSTQWAILCVGFVVAFEKDPRNLTARIDWEVTNSI